MERIIHSIVNVEKPRHVQVNVLKGSAGINGRDGTDGRDGMDGRNGGVFVPSVQDGIVTWNLEEEVSGTPSPVNMLANIESISNMEIYNIVNNGV